MTWRSTRNISFSRDKPLSKDTIMKKLEKVITLCTRCSNECALEGLSLSARVALFFGG